MNAKKITQSIILATIIGWIAWDIYVASNGIPGDTESEIIRTFASRHPAFPFCLGVLMGHFFWNTTKPRPRWLAFAGLPLMGIFVILLDASGIFPYMNPIGPFAVGIPIGFILWPQHAKPKG